MTMFLVACTLLYKPLCQSVGWSVGPSVAVSSQHATYGNRPCSFSLAFSLAFFLSFFLSFLLFSFSISSSLFFFLICFSLTAFLSFFLYRKNTLIFAKLIVKMSFKIIEKGRNFKNNFECTLSRTSAF